MAETTQLLQIAEVAYNAESHMKLRIMIAVEAAGDMSDKLPSRNSNSVASC